MNHSHIYIKLIDASLRKFHEHGGGSRYAEVAGELSQIKCGYRVNLPSALGGGGEAQYYPIRGSLLGQDFDKVAELAKQGSDE